MIDLLPKDIIEKHNVSEIDFLEVIFEESVERLTIKIKSKIAEEGFINDLSDFFSSKFTNTEIIIENISTNKLTDMSIDKNNLEEYKNDIFINDEESLVESYHFNPVPIEETIVDEGFNESSDYISYLDKIQMKEMEIAEETKNNISQVKSVEKSEVCSFTKPIKGEEVPISSLYGGLLEDQTVVIKGEIFSIEHRKTPKSNLVTFLITDNKSSYTVKKFMPDKDYNIFSEEYKEGSYVKVEGKISYDNYMKADVMELKSIYKEDKPIKMDFAQKKRVELHIHTQMSTMDGISPVEEYIKTAHRWGHKAVAITDSGVCQSFPDALNAYKYLKNKDDFKIIYGMEANVFDDLENILANSDKDYYEEYTVFDFETTGLTPKNSKIIEIGAVKVINGDIVDYFSELINPSEQISEFTTKLTSITNEMLEGKPSIEEILPKFIDFIGESVLVGHNVKFDMGFLRFNANEQGIEITNPSMDTLLFSRRLYPELGRHTLDSICKHLKVNLEQHHRAIDDSKATAEIFLKMMNEVKEGGLATVSEINAVSLPLELMKDKTYKLMILVKNEIGLKNLYKLVSFSNIKYYHRFPRIPKSVLIKHREGLLIGGAARDGEIIEALRTNEKRSEIINKLSFYDYVEILPEALHAEMIADDDSLDLDTIAFFNDKIIELSKEVKIFPVATGDAHYLEPHQNIIRKIITNGVKMNRLKVYPDLYFRTTDEMLELFSRYGEEVARELVITNSNLVADMIENISPIPAGTFPPILEGADEELKEMVTSKAHDIYGEILPEIVEKRIDRELNSIIDNGYAVMYIIAQKLVKKSNDDGYLVGSRGSVGSSFVATMTGITEVNPLPPHYICGKCNYSEFIETGEVDSGVDLPRKFCPVCNEEMGRDGFNIPFEVFLGFDGDKEPDIDLNFAGEYQSRAHKYTEELFGEDYVYRAGTISAIQEKTALGYILKYSEEKGIPIRDNDMVRLAKGMTGVKRTTGQHPGGVMIVPKNKEIYDFTPIQYPAEDKSKEVLTTHFDYNAISGKILKLDILGHDVPTMIKQLEEITGLPSTEIPLDDKETLKLFNGIEPLKLSEDSGIEMGTFGIPEFGTKFVMQMLKDTEPKTFSDLIRISGLSHGTDVWIGNAKDLVSSGEVPFNKVITTREDIMNTLIQYGVDNKTSFYTMERVRKGKGLEEETEALLREKMIPNWYIDSCNKIKYMFPKAHAVAYVMMSFRIAYYKIYYPLAFYATIFSAKAADFCAEYALKDLNYFINEKKRVEKLGNDATPKEVSTIGILDLLIEMYMRGFKLKKVDIYKSHASKFTIDGGDLLPPFISVDGLGENVALSICEEREKSDFMSKDDLRKRTGVNKTVLDLLDSMGVLNLTETDQLDLFNI